MLTIRMRLADAKDMARALLPHADDLWDGNVLNNIVVGTGEGQFAYATNRYTLARYDLTNVATEWPDEEMKIPAELLSALLTVGPKTLFLSDMLTYDVVIESAKSDIPAWRNKWVATLTIRNRRQIEGTEEYADDVHYLRTFRVAAQDKPMPPLTRLFENWLPGEEIQNPVILDPNYLGKFSGYATRNRKAMRLTLPARTTPERRQSAGVLVEVGTRVKGIMMPILYTVGGVNDFGTDLVAMNVARDEARRAEAESQPADSAPPTDGEPMTDAASSGMPDE